jgi:hypothetical protein
MMTPNRVTQAVSGKQMDITLSRTKIKQFSLVALVLITLVVIGVTAWSSGTLDRFLVAEHQEVTGAPNSLLTTIENIYSPDLSGGQEAWYAQVCEGMSEQGCELFKGMYGATIWGSLESGAIAPIEAQAVLLEEVETLEDGRQVWKVGFTVLDVSDARPTQDVPEPREISGEIYIEVSYDQGTDRWLLDRILFDQEVEARYGK